MNRRIKKDTKGLDIANLDDFTEIEEEEKKNEGVKSVPEKRKTFPRRYEVETILEQRENRGEIEYLVKWTRWAHKDNTWEPRKHLERTAEQILMEFERRQQETKGKRDDDQRQQEAKRKRDDEEDKRKGDDKRKKENKDQEKSDQAKKSKPKVGTDKNGGNYPLASAAATRNGRLLQDASDSDDCIEIVKEEMVKGKPYVENGNQEEVTAVPAAPVPANERLAENEETEDGGDDVEIDIKIKMKSKTFGKVIDKATKFLDAAAKFNKKEDDI